MMFALMAANCQPSGGGSSDGTGGSPSKGGNSGNGGSGSGGSSANGNGGNSSSGGSNASGGSSSSGGSSTSSGGSNSAGGSNNSAGGTTSGAGGSTSTGPATCTTDLMTLRSGTDFNWIATNPSACSIQGSIYAYGDGSTCTAPSPISATACTTASCCISGTTVVDTTYAKYGCGLGLDLNSSGGATATKSRYAGSAKGFKVTIAGTVATGQKIRIMFPSTATPPTGGTAPYKEFTGVGTYSVLFSDATCPSWATAAQCTPVSGSGAYSLQVQIVGGTVTGDAVGAFSNVCITSITPL